MASIRYTIFHDLEDRPLQTIPICWKIAHIVGFLAVSVTGFLGFYFIKQAIALTSQDCILFSNLELEHVCNRTWAIVIEYSDWGTSYDCGMPMLVTLLTFLYGVMFSILFAMCGADRFGLSPPNKIVAPGFVLCFVATAASIYCTKHVTKGLNIFCQNIISQLQNKTETRNVNSNLVSDYSICGITATQLLLEGKSVTAEYGYFDTATVILFVQCLLWTFNGIAIIARCLLVTDYILINTIVASYAVNSDVSKDEGLYFDETQSRTSGSFSIHVYSPTDSDISLSRPQRRVTKILTIKDHDTSITMKEAIQLYKNDPRSSRTSSSMYNLNKISQQLRTITSLDNISIETDSDITIYVKKITTSPGVDKEKPNNIGDDDTDGSKTTQNSDANDSQESSHIDDQNRDNRNREDKLSIISSSEESSSENVVTDKKETNPASFDSSVTLPFEIDSTEKVTSDSQSSNETKSRFDQNRKRESMAKLSLASNDVIEETSKTQPNNTGARRKESMTSQLSKEQANKKRQSITKKSKMQNPKK